MDIEDIVTNDQHDTIIDFVTDLSYDKYNHRKRANSCYGRFYS